MWSEIMQAALGGVSRSLETHSRVPTWGSGQTPSEKTAQKVESAVSGKPEPSMIYKPATNVTLELEITVYTKTEKSGNRDDGNTNNEDRQGGNSNEAGKDINERGRDAD